MAPLVDLSVKERGAQGYLAKPAGDGPWPAVVVIQEWWGLNDNIKSIADRFAAAGYVAIAPDLYDGHVATEPDDARKHAMALEWRGALNVIQAAIDFLLADADVSSTNVGITGFCMGGGLTWHAAAKLKHVGAAVPFYGGGPELSQDDVNKIRCPVLGIFGELDQGVSPEVANRRAAMMDTAGVSHKTIIYENAHHAFFNDTRPIYNEEAADDAWSRMMQLFAEHIG